MKFECCCEKLQTLCAQAPGNIRVYLKVLRGGAGEYGYRAEEKTVSASTIKVGILLYYAYLMQKEEIAPQTLLPIPQGRILYDSTVIKPGMAEATLHDLLTWMITLSDNTATNILILYAGMETLNAHMRSLGLKEAKIERLMLDFDAIERGYNNYTSAVDQYRMFSMLYYQSILTPRLCGYCLDILSSIRGSEKFVDVLPQNIKVAHKPGGLPRLLHDAGIIYCENTDYFLAVLMTEAEEEEAAACIGEIARSCYELLAQEV